MQTFPLPLCQGIRGFSVTKQKALAKAAVFALMKRSASSLSEEEARKIFDLPNTRTPPLDYSGTTTNGENHAKIIRPPAPVPQSQRSRKKR